MVLFIAGFAETFSPNCQQKFPMGDESPYYKRNLFLETSDVACVEGS